MKKKFCVGPIVRYQCIFEKWKKNVSLFDICRLNYLDNRVHQSPGKLEAMSRVKFVGGKRDI